MFEHKYIYGLLGIKNKQCFLGTPIGSRYNPFNMTFLWKKYRGEEEESKKSSHKNESK